MSPRRDPTPAGVGEEAGGSRESQGILRGSDGIRGPWAPSGPRQRLRLAVPLLLPTHLFTEAFIHLPIQTVCCDPILMPPPLPPPDSYVEALRPSVLVLGGGALGVGCVN